MNTYYASYYEVVSNALLLPPSLAQKRNEVSYVYITADKILVYVL
jgi:hypothetical protein